MTTTNKGLIQPTNGSYVDTWDQPVNNDWSYIDTAFGGAVSLNATGISTHTLTLTEYRPLFLSISGAMSNNVTYSIPSGVGGQWVIFNGTTDATGGPWNIIFTCVGSAVTVTIPRGTTTNVACDGINLLFADGRPGSPGGSNTQVQYNNNGTLAGSANFVFDGAHVGIGTASPGSYGVLAAAGSTGVTYVNYQGTGVAFTYGGTNYIATATAGGQIQFQTGAGNNAMLIDSSGNVGVGTTSPSSFAGKFVVQSSDSANTIIATAASGMTRIMGYDGSRSASAIEATNASQTSYVNLLLGANILQFATNGSEKMRIDASGNVGIGTTSPSSALDVNGNTNIRNTLFLGSTALQNIAANSTTLYFRGSAFAFQNVAATTTQLYINFSGNVGIGTNSPSQLLQVAGTIYSSSGGFQFPDNTVQTTAAITATGVGNLYTYALLQYLGGAIAVGTNVTSNGSNLVYVDTSGASSSNYIPAGQIWQAMGYGNAPTLFQRTT